MGLRESKGNMNGSYILYLTLNKRKEACPASPQQKTRRYQAWILSAIVGRTMGLQEVGGGLWKRRGWVCRKARGPEEEEGLGLQEE